jgi:ABC-type polysaccharide/polyol phosphate transport system ATPase subunit
MASSRGRAGQARVALHGVGLRFRLVRDQPGSLKGALLARVRAPRAEPFWALRGVTVAAGPGEAVGIVGANGSGKSTLLRVAAGIYRPTEGTVRVAGRVAPMIELGAGFDPELSGRDNVFLTGALLGRTRREMAARLDAIAAFAGLGPFLDAPVKTYSSGMHARLGFAIAADVDPDVLLVDEVLAVGDAAFQARCAERLREIRAAGATVLLVSHDPAAVEALCTRAVVLAGGRVAYDGPVAGALARLAEAPSPSPAAVSAAPGPAGAPPSAARPRAPGPRAPSPGRARPA